MSDLNDLEQEFLSKDRASTDKDGDSLPPGFRELLPALQRDPTRLAADRQSRLATVRRLLDQLDSADNGAVKMQKSRVIRAELNALHELNAEAD